MYGRPPTGAHFARGCSDSSPARIDRHRLLFALGATFAAVPLLVVDNLPANAEASEAPSVAADQPDDREHAEPGSSSSTLPAAPAPTAAAAVTTAPASTTTEDPTTSTTAPQRDPEPDMALAAPATTAAPPATTQPRSTERGEATWYEQPSGYSPNGCAHKSVPFGTSVTVTNVANGRSTTCQVNDRGPYGEGRVIDLDDDVYARIAPLSTGVITVIISW
jgi:hypothetical protein